MHVETTSAAAAEFEPSAEAIARRVRAALADVVAGIPGFTYRRPNDLAGELGIDPKLAWRIGRSISMADHFASAQFFPGPAGMKAFLRAAEQHRASERTLREAHAAFQAFREIVRAHAGSRKVFDMLTAGHVRSGDGSGGGEHRRLMYEGSSFVWGVQARTLFRICILHPSANDETHDLVNIRGYVDLCRMRPNVSWRVDTLRSVDDQHRVHTEFRETALDEGTTGPVPLLREFCCGPPPQFRRVTGAHGLPQFELVDGPVGNTARATYVIGEVLRCVEPRFANERYTDFCMLLPVRTPAEVLVFDVLMHQSLCKDDDPAAAELYSDLFGGGPMLHYEASDRLPLLNDSLETYSGAADVAFTPEIPRYSEIIRCAFEHLGWRRNEFTLHRLRLPYPPLSTTAVIRRHMLRRE